jgi:gliding motility-associated-like protein
MNPFWQNSLKQFKKISFLPICTLLLLYITCSISVSGQIDTRNRRPKIRDQKELQINEGESITIQLTDLVVEDADDWFYPFGFTMKIYDGEDYVYSEQTVTPDENFEGTLKVKVTVNDGEDDSDPYEVQITVNGINDPPQITQQQEVSIDEDHSLTLSTSHLVIEDPDNSEFNLHIQGGDHYTVANAIITPEPNFFGAISVPVRVDDGLLTSNDYNLLINVNAINDPPKINGQKLITTDEDVAIAITSDHLEIEDPDNAAFTVVPNSGDHYTLNTSTIVPESNFSGNLSVPVTVSDENDVSNTFPVVITVNAVNDAPKITGQQQLSALYPTPIQIDLTHLTVEDPDNQYPDDFSLSVLNGENYTVSGTTVTPNTDLNSTLNVVVRVNDGTADSEDFPLEIEVKKGNAKPIIINQKPVIISEDQSFTIEFSHLIVEDDGDYPKGFTLNVAPGENFTVENTTIKPKANFFGNVFAKVSVNDGEKTSEPFNFQITVSPVNDPPIITMTDDDSVAIPQESTAMAIFTNVSISDLDDESLALAEIAIDPETYEAASDVLQFTSTDAIKGVFDAPHGILALIGKATPDEYATALQSVQLIIGPGSPVMKKISVTVNDGQANSLPIKKAFYKSTGEVVTFDIPTGFTPNGDLVNDTWSIVPAATEQVQEAKVRVYTRSGLLVFEADDLATSWDGLYNGNELPADVYFYTVDFKTNSPEPPNSFSGIVTILR